MSSTDTSPIVGFEYDYKFLDLFFPANVYLTGEHIPYRSVGHAFYASRFHSPDDRTLIRNTSDRVRARKESTSANPSRIRTDWPTVHMSIMRELNRQKFDRYPDLKRALLNTGDRELVYFNNWHDSYWGRTARDGGENWLGRILMSIRGAYRL